MNLPHIPQEYIAVSTFRGVDREIPYIRNVQQVGAFNISLEQRQIWDLNEESLVRDRDRLQSLLPCDRRLYWLTWARLMELGLICGGNYVDNCEFEAAGDLLVNPRCVHIHLKGVSEPVLKKRHIRLSEQTGFETPGGLNLAGLLRDCTITEIREKPLLVHLYDALKDSGRIASDYLLSVQFRMKRMADTVGFLSAWKIQDSAALQTRLQKSDPMLRSFVESNLCRFDRKLFFMIGRDVSKMLEDPDYQSGFICNSQPA